jgi:DNA-binding NarL/FixJ family response regulator
METGGGNVSKVHNGRLIAINFDKDSRDMVLEVFGESRIEVVFVELPAFMAGAPIEPSPFDVIALNLSFQPQRFLHVIPVVKRSFPDSEIIVLSRSADDRMWCEALDLGAHDLLPDPPENREFLMAVAKAGRRLNPPEPGMHSAVA